MTAPNGLDELLEQVRAAEHPNLRRRTFRTPSQLRSWLLARPTSRRITLIAAVAAVSAVNCAVQCIPAPPMVRVINYGLVVLFVALLLALVPVALSGRRRARGPGLPPVPYDWASPAAESAEVCCRLCPVEDVAPGEQRKHTCVCHELAQSKRKER
jgi:hypothetical protein